ncbi:IS66 family transposase ISBcen19 [Oligella sp. MSHR50489EDL]|uniref:IS66 family transposase n=1 Tax=Oligella sp. MSHR50489EDL TaxID=3139409 RepID=UPI003D815DD2
MPNSSFTLPTNLDALSANELRQLLLQSHAALGKQEAVIVAQQAVIAECEQTIVEHQRTIVERDASNRLLNQQLEQVRMELAILRRIRFDKSHEHLDQRQYRLFEEDIRSDIGEKEEQLRQLAEQLQEEPAKRAPRGRRRINENALPTGIPVVEIHHELEDTACGCGCQLQRVGEDVSHKLDYQPGKFTLEKHIRGKYVCQPCQTLRQAPVPAQIIDKGLASSGLLAAVLTMKYVDHLPLYRQESIFERAGIRLSRTTLADWVGQCGAQLAPLVDALRKELLKQSVLHADETPVRYMHHKKDKPQRGFFWVYAPSAYSAFKAVVYDFREGRSGVYAREFLGDWQGSLMCDDYAGYKALFASGQVIEAGCWAHARRKFHDVYQANGSAVAQQALATIQVLYRHEAQAKQPAPPERLSYRQRYLKPVIDTFADWLRAQQAIVPPNSAIAKAIGYSLNNWPALTRLLDDAMVPMDNNAVENLIRPLAIGRKNWLFVGSPIAGRRAAVIMSLIQSAKLNGHDPHAYLKDVLERLPTHKARDIAALLPHNWQPLTATSNS